MSPPHIGQQSKVAKRFGSVHIGAVGAVHVGTVGGNGSSGSSTTIARRPMLGCQGRGAPSILTGMPDDGYREEAEEWRKEPGWARARRARFAKLIGRRALQANDDYVVLNASLTARVVAPVAGTSSVDGQTKISGVMSVASSSSGRSG